MKKILILLVITTLLIGHTLSVKAQVKSTEWIVYDTTNSGLPSNGVKSIVIDSIGNKWIGTYGGLVKFDGATWTIWDTSNSGLPNNNVEIVVLDSAENKWIGTFWGSGLTKFDGTTWITWNTSNSGLPSNFVTAISIDDTGNVWIGTIAGLTKYNGTTWTTWNTSNSGLPDNSVNSIVIDSADNKWIGTGYGFVKFDGITWTTFYSVIFPYCYVYSLTVDQINNVWIGYGGCGLSYYNGNSGINYNTSNSPLPVNSAGALVIDSIGNLWLSSQSLIKYNMGVWTIWDTTNSELPDNNAGSIAIDNVGNKWIGTWYGGLAVFREGGIVGINNENSFPKKKNDFAVFPNPANQYIEITGVFIGNEYYYEIINSEGKTLSSNKIVQNNQKINIKNLSIGIYFIKVKNKANIKTVKFIVM